MFRLDVKNVGLFEVLEVGLIDFLKVVFVVQRERLAERIVDDVYRRFAGVSGRFRRRVDSCSLLRRVVWSSRLLEIGDASMIAVFWVRSCVMYSLLWCLLVSAAMVV